MDIDPQDLEAYRRIDRREDARAALDRTLARARHRLQLFDASGEFWGLDRKAFAEGLHALLQRSREASATIVVHDVSWIERNGPRLVELLRRHAPRLQVLAADPDVRGFSTGIVVADGTVVLRRPHFERPQVFVDFDEAAVAAAERLFRELVDGARPGISGTVTGL